MRRCVSARFSCSFFAVFIWSGTTLLAQAEAPSRPNIILCMADDLGWGDTGYNGNQVVKTPHLDEMARTGVKFDRWYAGAPVCSPTRGNCLTGRHHLRLGIPTANRGHLRPAESTLAERLKQLGYATGHFGKWHLGTLTTTLKDSNRGRPGDAADYAPPWEHGFEVCFSTEAKVPTYDPMKKPKPGNNLRYGWRPIAGDDFEHYGTHYFDEHGSVVTDNLEGDDSRVIMDRAIPFVRQSAKNAQPFFMVVWFHAPHLPVVAGPRHAAMYSDLDWKQQMYYGCITALDEQMGRLRAELQALGIAENTMTWFSSDNGPENGTPGTAGDLRARKRSLYEGGIRVPGLLTWPSRIPSARTVTAPCHTGDYYPTILAVLRQPAGNLDLDGVNIWPLVEGVATQRNRVIQFQFGKQAAVVGDQYKLYRANAESPWELYDLTADRSEAHDLASRSPQIAKALSDSFAAWSVNLSR